MMISSRSSAAVSGRLAHAQVIEDETRHGGQELHPLLAGVINGSFGQLFQQMMRLAVEDTVALLDGGLTDGLSQVAFAGARWTENEGILVANDEGAGGQIENQAAVHFGIEGEVKAVQGFVGITELGLLAPAFQ